jgi:hypothetical protein
MIWVWAPQGVCQAEAAQGDLMTFAANRPWSDPEYAGNSRCK